MPFNTGVRVDGPYFAGKSYCQPISLALSGQGMGQIALTQPLFQVPMIQGRHPRNMLLQLGSNIGRQNGNLSLPSFPPLTYRFFWTNNRSWIRKRIDSISRYPEAWISLAMSRYTAHVQETSAEPLHRSGPRPAAWPFSIRQERYHTGESTGYVEREKPGH